MKIIRTGPRGGRKTVAKLDNTTAEAAYERLKELASKEANHREDVRHIALINQYVPREGEAHIVGNYHNTMAVYSQVWA